MNGLTPRRHDFLIGGQILDTSVNLECGVDAQELSEQGCRDALSEQGCRDAFPVVLAPPPKKP